MDSAWRCSASARRDAERERRRQAYLKRAEERKQLYSEKLQARIEKMEQREAELAAQLEKMHQEADERRQKLQEYRDAMQDMTPEERMAYVEEHRDEVFGSSRAERPREYRAPARPPWTMQPPRPYAYPAP